MDFKLEDFDDEGEESNGDGPVSGRNCIVFLVDASESMFDHKTEDGHTSRFFQQSIQCCKDALLQMCKKETNDMAAIVLYGTNKKQGKYAKDNTVLLQPLGEPTVKNINELEEIIKDNGEQIRSNYGHNSAYKLHDVLLYCQTVINNSEVKFFTKNVVIFTNENRPHRSPEYEFRSRKQAEEYFKHEIEIEVVGLGDFGSSEFYKELILTSRGELMKDWEGKDPVKGLKDMSSEIAKLTNKFSRRLSFLNMGSCPGAAYKLQIALYKLYSEPKKFRTFKTKELNNDTQMVEDEPQNTEEMAANAEANTHLEYTSKNGYNSESGDIALVGGKEIKIQKSELRKLLAKNSRGFDIIGFKKTEDIPLYYSIAEPYFLEPYGKDENNQKVFSHLVRRCLERGLSIICWFTLTLSSRPVVCALHPTEANTYAKNRDHPPGFVASRLPFSEMLLEPDEIENNGRPSDVQSKAALEIVKKTTIPYTVDMFSDYERQKRLIMIESLAFEYEDVPEVDDDTDIDLEDMSEMLDSLNLEFTECPHIEEETGRPTKRAASSQLPGTPKLQKLDSPLLMVKNGFANKLTVAQLRDLLKAEGIKSLSAMNKPTLVKIANQRFGES